MSEKNILAIPGPTMFHPMVLRSLGVENMGHMSREFVEIFSKALKDLRKLVYADDGVQPVVLAGSGTLAMEASVSNLISKGDNILVVVNGYFGWSMRDILNRYPVNIDLIEIKSPGEVVDNKRIFEKLDEKEYSMVTVTHVDTSTGVRHPIKELAEEVRDRKCILVVDGVCSVAGEEIRMSEWGIDVLFTGSQKALGVPAGLGILWLSEKALHRLKETESALSPYYMDLSRWVKVMKSYEEMKPIYYATPAVNLIWGLWKSLEIIFDEGLENRFRRHKILSRALRKGLKAIGLDIMAREEYAASTITSVYLPGEVSPSDFKREMLSRNVVIAGGIYPGLREKYFRIGHMGIMDFNDGVSILAAIERSLYVLGYDLEPGAGLKAYQNMLLSEGV
jgi:alanine-glyoxylate transaminase/serine-glyoxylate transaminase/serine-pyruvate transaminase